jgi:hypothetical protein
LIDKCSSSLASLPPRATRGPHPLRPSPPPQLDRGGESAAASQPMFVCTPSLLLVILPLPLPLIPSPHHNVTLWSPAPSSSTLWRCLGPSAFVIVVCYLWVTYLGRRHVGSLFTGLLMFPVDIALDHMG